MVNGIEVLESAESPGLEGGNDIPRTALGFWEYPKIIASLKGELPDNEGLAIVLPQVESVPIFEGNAAEPTIVFTFPPYEFKVRFRLRNLPGEAFVQGGEALDRVRLYLTFVVGHIVPTSTWIMSKTSHAPVQLGEQPILGFLFATRDVLSPEEVWERYLEAYSSTERLLDAVPPGSPLDLAIRSYGQGSSLSRGGKLTECWKALEILGRAHGPKDLPVQGGRRLVAYVEGLNLSPGAATLNHWRRLRNRVAHGSALDESAREVQDVASSLHAMTYRVLAEQSLEETGLFIKRVWG